MISVEKKKSGFWHPKSLKAYKIFQNLPNFFGKSVESFGILKLNISPRQYSIEVYMPHET